MGRHVLYRMLNLTVVAALKTAVQRLAAAHCDTPQLDAEVLLAHTLNKNRTWLYTFPNAELNAGQSQSFLEAVARRANREPVAYITGHKEFFALDFIVSPAVLIPRPETELLVETALELAANLARPTIADVGTGSGCIAVTLARHLPAANLLAGDISPAALAIARQNAAQHRVENRITFVAGNLLEPIPTAVDIIASNPPYISRPELAQTMPEVQRHEPRLALEGGVTGLEIIAQLLAQSPKKLKPGGAILIEIGFAQGPAVAALARQHFPQANIQIKPDLAGLDRLLVVKDTAAAV